MTPWQQKLGIHFYGKYGTSGVFCIRPYLNLDSSLRLAVKSLTE